MAALATILIPTFDHGETLRFALRRALRQTVEDVEVLVVGDGVPEPAKRRLREWVEADRRVRFFDFPKHERRGEPYRHQVLQEATGRIVCYLCDRDLWLPDHVERMLGMLETADFAHALSLHILPGDGWRHFPVDLAHPVDRERMLRCFNRVPLSCAAHRMDFYRRLPHGWRTTPPETQTDWYMFQQFLAQPGCRAVSGTYPSAATFPSPPRKDWPASRRLEELERWDRLLDTAEGLQGFLVGALESAVRARDAERAEFLGALEQLERTRWHRWGLAIRGWPGVSALAAAVRRITG